MNKLINKRPFGKKQNAITKERIAAAKALFEAGLRSGVIAKTLNLGTSTYCKIKKTGFNYDAYRDAITAQWTKQNQKRNEAVQKKAEGKPEVVVPETPVGKTGDATTLFQHLTKIQVTLEALLRLEESKMEFAKKRGESRGWFGWNKGSAAAEEWRNKQFEHKDL